MAEFRYFVPKRTDTLAERCKVWIGKQVTVRSWHQNMAMTKTHPEDEVVGFVRAVNLMDAAKAVSHVGLERVDQVERVGIAW